MIVRWDGDAVLLDVQGLWAHCGRRPISTIRRYCEPIACDVATKVHLYDADDSAERLKSVKRRASHSRTSRVA